MTDHGDHRSPAPGPSPALPTRTAELPDIVPCALLEQLDLDITTLRTLIAELRPAALDQLGLEPALEALLDRSRRGGIEVTAGVNLGDDSAEGRLTGELKTAVYRLVQEAVTQCRLSLTSAPGEGTTVTATLPAIRRAGPDRARSSPAPPASSAPPSAGYGLGATRRSAR